MSTRPTSSSASADEGYSLAALFVFTAACAVPLALAAAVMRGVREGEIAAVHSGEAAFTGGIVGLILGVLVGLHHYRQPRGILLGCLTGALIGAASGPLSLVKPAQIPGIFIASCIGAALLVVISAVLGWMSRPPADERGDKLALYDFEPPAFVAASAAEREAEAETPVA